MPRYVSKETRSSDDYYLPPLMTNVVVTETEGVDTGLVDSKGRRIYRQPNPIGFGKDHEW